MGQNKFKCRQQRGEGEGGQLNVFSLDFALLKKLIYNFAFASVRAAKQVDLQADMYGILYYIHA